MPLWVAAYMGALALPSPLPAPLWHGHEMLFGYAAAVLAGFLLTATPGWSGRPPVQGGGLALLGLIWLAGRVASSAGGRFPALAAAVDLAFLPALALAITPALQSAPRRNRVFLPFLGVLLLANLGVQDAQGVLPGLGPIALRVALDLFVLLIALIGGRVVPAFAGNALAAQGQAEPRSTSPVSDGFAIGSLVLLLLVDLADFRRPAGRSRSRRRSSMPAPPRLAGQPNASPADPVGAASRVRVAGDRAGLERNGRPDRRAAAGGRSPRPRDRGRWAP